jgi:hypothetical protein
MKLNETIIGFVGFGEVNTPRSVIESKCQAAKAALAALACTVIDTAPVSDDLAGVDVARAIEELSRTPLDALVICVAGWIPSHAVINVTSEFSHLPILLWGLSGYYENGRLITTADQAGTSAIRKTMQDLGYRFAYAFEFPGKPLNLQRLEIFVHSVHATRMLRRAKIGSMGYRDMQLYATLHDGVSLKKALGVEVETFEMLEMTHRMEQVGTDEIQHWVAWVKRAWKFESPAAPGTLEKSIRCFVALKSIFAERKYSAVSLIDVDGMKKLIQLPPSMVLMLITDELKLPTIPENDILGSVTQLIVRHLTGQAAAYFEIYEFMEERVLVGVPDYVPSEIVDGDVQVRPTRFGTFNEGILNVSRVKTGRVTLVRLLPHRGSYALHAVTGTAVAPGPWEEAGWAPPAPQLPSLEVILDRSVEAFAENVAGQHYILAYGDITPALRLFSKLNALTFID